jgi:PKD repeat protein
MKIIHLFFFFGILIYGIQAQVSDDFSDGNFTSNPTWSGDNSSYEVLNGELHLNAPAASDRAYLSTTSTSIDNSEWEMLFRMDANPSNNNHARFYVVSDQSNVEGSLNGYFIKIGGSEDEISLYKQDAYQETEIIDGTDDRVDMSSVVVRVKLSRDNLGNWALYSDNTGGTSFVQEGIAFDNSHTSSQYCGVYTKYSSSYSTDYYYDDIVSGSCTASASPSADFSTSNTSISTGTSINFTDLSTECPSSWSWSFSGGTPSTSTDKHPSGISYNTPGTYNVSLTIDNGIGIDTETKNGYIIVANGTVPGASFNCSSANPTINNVVSFNDLSSNNPTSWTWVISPSSYTFTNTTNANSQNIDVIFSSPGSYNIELTATNSFGSNTQSQVYYVDHSPCDTLMLYTVPAYSIQPSNLPNFQIDKIDNDFLNPPKYLLAIEVTSIPSGVWSGWWDNLSKADIYIELFDGNYIGNAVTPDWTSSVYDNATPPVSWPYPTSLKIDTGDYTIKVWDEDGLNYDDLIAEFLIDGSDITQSSSTSLTSSDGNGTSIKITSTTNGASTNWWEQTVFDGTNYNTFLASSSWFYPYGQADNWLIMGPISIPSSGATLEWKHKIESNDWRDGYTVFASEYGNLINNFTSGGYVIKDFIDNSALTDGDTIWKNQTATLDASTYGNKDIYLAFNHNADDQWYLYLDDIHLKDCNNTITDLTELLSNKSTIKVYPNPAQDIVNIELPESFIGKTSKLSLYNISGQLVHRVDIDGDAKYVLKRTPDFEMGHYYLEINNGNESVNTKIIFN